MKAFAIALPTLTLYWVLQFALISTQTLHERTVGTSTIIARISPPWPDPSGIAVSRNGHRVFLGFPRDPYNHATCALAELLPNGDIIPFPDKALSAPSKKPYAEWIVSPNGIYMDRDDVLWIADDGKREGIPGVPPGAAKVVGIDIATGIVVRTIVIPPDIMTNDTRLNDLCVDTAHGVIYIANSGFENRSSLIVLNVASGRGREVLLNHWTTKPDPGFLVFLEGVPKVLGVDKFPSGGVDGITLSADGRTVYWTINSARRLYSIPTRLLSNFTASERDLERAAIFEGEHPPCDGITTDESGNIYFGAVEHESIVKRSPNGRYEVVAHDAANFVWPDGLAYRDGYVYATMGQWNRLGVFNAGVDLRKPPYLVVKIKV
ncbi:hypothetical protein BV898_09482 [Hypsibius exemplaris]|uniref:Major royal jelly protein n=1 Tax=Hypsibius exemplaris TaxID=2072580 RepID=A0A1W0WM91_HYPEX|nr:hypothetical protein BV898_09482 [Hypsibius exemplaris]